MEELKQNAEVTRVALVEDDNEIRQVYSFIINQTVDLICEPFAEAEGLLTYTGKPFDLIIMDVNLPGIDGIECTSLVRKKWPECQVMMFTVFENNEQIFNALAAGANGYLVKQSSPEIILDAIRELLNGGAPMSGNVARKIIEHYRLKEQKPSETYGLSPREQEILDLLSKGYRYNDIADRLFISFGTVRTHIYNIYLKLHVDNRTSAINKWNSR